MHGDDNSIKSCLLEVNLRKSTDSVLEVAIAKPLDRENLVIRNVRLFVARYYTTKCASQFGVSSFFTMATYWVLDLPNINGFFLPPFAFC